MEKKIISKRIREAMKIRNINQSDMAEKSNISKSSLSEYITGKYSPKQTNIYKMSKILNVNPAWLMGYDVPMEIRENYGDEFIFDDMSSKDINLSQLSIMTGIDLHELKEITSEKNKIVYPSRLKKIADALESNYYDYLISYGYVEDAFEHDNDLYNTGVRYLLPMEERYFLCDYLEKKWNEDIENKNYFTRDNIYKTIFNDEKEMFTADEVRQIINHTFIRLKKEEYENK